MVERSGRTSVPEFSARVAFAAASDGCILTDLAARFDARLTLVPTCKA